MFKFETYPGDAVHYCREDGLWDGIESVCVPFLVKEIQFDPAILPCKPPNVKSSNVKVIKRYIISFENTVSVLGTYPVILIDFAALMAQYLWYWWSNSKVTYQESRIPKTCHETTHKPTVLDHTLYCDIYPRF